MLTAIDPLGVVTSKTVDCCGAGYINQVTAIK
jgi:hypothetical protein